MPFHTGPGNDAGLLVIIGSVRERLDLVTRLMSQHMEVHPDHSLSECLEGMSKVAIAFLQCGATLTVNGTTILESLIESMGDEMGEG